MSEPRWHKLGPIDTLQKLPLQQIRVGSTQIALSYAAGKFGAISGICLHVGGPLGDGTVENDYVVCPWHSWMFHRCTGEARPGIPAAVARFELKEENGDLYVNLQPATHAKHAPHPPHPLSREIHREPGPIRVVGISTTAMDRAHPRFSTSDFLLEMALAHAREKLGAQTRLLKLNDLNFRTCEGYYSKSADACTWPCTITQMDDTDQLAQVYEALVFWGDVILVGTPIRWGAPSSLYAKMIERMNCIQNQITIANRLLIQNKVAGFVIMGGQDNIQAVAGQMLTFFGELGFQFPQFPFVAHSRGWTAEDMEANVKHIHESPELRDGVQALVERCVGMASVLINAAPVAATERGGRKAQPI
jgi:nitrite reductase/ring-hydroxylating ferredoxin subunit/multimeric flavodoxin WrbA